MTSCQILFFIFIRFFSSLFLLPQFYLEVDLKPLSVEVNEASSLRLLGAENENAELRRRLERLQAEQEVRGHMTGLVKWIVCNATITFYDLQINVYMNIIWIWEICSLQTENLYTVFMYLSSQFSYIISDLCSSSKAQFTDLQYWLWIDDTWMQCWFDFLWMIHFDKNLTP